MNDELYTQELGAALRAMSGTAAVLAAAVAAALTLTGAHRHVEPEPLNTDSCQRFHLTVLSGPAISL